MVGLKSATSGLDLGSFHVLEADFTGGPGSSTEITVDMVYNGDADGENVTLELSNPAVRGQIAFDNVRVYVMSA